MCLRVPLRIYIGNKAFFVAGKSKNNHEYLYISFAFSQLLLESKLGINSSVT